jgi:hypothetical protein
MITSYTKAAKEKEISEIKLMAAHLKNCGLMLNYSKTKFMIIGNNHVSQANFTELNIDDTTSLARVNSASMTNSTIYLINLLTLHVFSIIRCHLRREMLLNFLMATLLLTSEQTLRLQRLQNR